MLLTVLGLDRRNLYTIAGNEAAIGRVPNIDTNCIERVIKLIKDRGIIYLHDDPGLTTSSSRYLIQLLFQKVTDTAEGKDLSIEEIEMLETDRESAIRLVLGYRADLNEKFEIFKPYSAAVYRDWQSLLTVVEHLSQEA